MDIPDSLLTLYSAEVTERKGSYVVEVPAAEVEGGTVSPGAVVRVGVIDRPNRQTTTETTTASRDRQTGEAPPVEQGDTVDVEIEDLGEQGDGIARIGPGYIVFVPDTAVGDRVTVEITEARDSFGFADVIDGPF